MSPSIFIQCCSNQSVCFSLLYLEICSKGIRIVFYCTVSQVKLEEALTQATDFHNSLQDFINWLTQAEQTLNMVSPASLILETIMFQIDEHKVMLHNL